MEGFDLDGVTELLEHEGSLIVISLHLQLW